jgi:predicted nuclease of predicted toxin-antitoxin system
MKILIDMNLSPSWENYLAEEGFECVHWSKIGKGNEPDSILFEFAKKNDYLILTHDLDFEAILAHTKENGPSVVQIRSNNITPAVYGKKLVSAIKQAEAYLKEGALVIIDETRSRIRVLPLKK